MNTKSNQGLEGMKQYYKMLLTPTMSHEDKVDELWDLPNEDLVVLLEHFTAEEDYRTCLAIKAVLDEKG